MGLLDNLGIAQLLSGLGGPGLVGGPQKAAPGALVFRGFVEVEDGDVAYNTAAEVYGAIGAAGIWTRIWEMTIPAQQRVAWGSGTPALPQNQGFMWFAMLDSGTDWSIGTLRLMIQDHGRNRTFPVASIPDSQLHSTTVTSIATAALLNKNEMIALPEKREFDLVGEDSRIALDYRLRTAATAVDAAGFRIPITTYQ